jgi:hypothetical protein
MKFLRGLFTREIEAVYFSDGDVFVGGRHPIPEKPEGIGRQMIRVREWRWRPLRRIVRPR